MMMAKSRGISTFIATLLLMVLAVAAGAIIYAYTMGYLGGLGTTKTPGTLSLDSATATVKENATGTKKYDVIITAYVRNIGKGTVTLDRGYVDGVLYNKTIATTIDENKYAKITIKMWDYSDSDPTGKTFEVKLVATDGTNLVFTVKAD